jgi:hypothetical protein
MPEKETEIAQDKVVAETRETIRRGLNMISNVVHARQSEMGYWPEDDGRPIDYRIFFAELHSKVASAYETYKEERDPTHITWTDPATGQEVEPGKGLPQGLATDLIDIVFDILGFATNVGINVGALAAHVAIIMKSNTGVGTMGGDAARASGGVAGLEDGDDGDEEDFDLEAILGAEVQAAPESIEIKTPVEGEQKPETP